MNEIIEKLDRLADLQSHVTVIKLRFDQLRDEILTPEIKAQLEDIEAERKTSIDAIQGGMETLEAEIKEAVVLSGATVKGKFLQAVWMKGRESVDMKVFKGYAVAHPEVQPFIKQGLPSVSIRKIG